MASQKNQDQMANLTPLEKNIQTDYQIQECLRAVKTVLVKDTVVKCW